MIIKSCRLQTSASGPESFPRDRFPQIAFMGASNVGKSSLINRLLGRRSLARTSKTPGRTRAIYFYLVNGKLYFVDLPGYGYARVPETLRRAWKGLVEAYLGGRPGPDLSFLLVDARRDPSELDRQLIEWLQSRRLPLRVVLTKADKLSRSRRARAVTRTTRALGLAPEQRPLVTSVTTGDGVQPMWSAIDGSLAERRSPLTDLPSPEGGGILVAGPVNEPGRPHPSLKQRH